MKYLLLTATLLMSILSIVACDQPKKSPPKRTKVNNSEVSGFQVFKQYCKTCHGANGALGLNGAKDLRESVLTLEERIQTITFGRGVMTPFEDILTKEEIKAVAEYTTTLK